MILNRNTDARAHILGPGGDCALCHCHAPDGPNDGRMVEIAFPAYTNFPEGSWIGRYLLVTLCQDCAIALGQALAPVVKQMQTERDDRRRETREWLAQQRRAEGGQP